VPDDEFIFLVLGLMRPYKGVSDALRAFQRARRPGDRLLLAGSFQDEELRREATQTAEVDPTIVVVDRRLADDELPVYFGAADVALLPFRRATTSGSAILALGFGVPVVATAVGNVVDLVTPACGILVAPDDVEALARALDQAHEFGPEAGPAARARAAEFTWQAAAEMIVRALAEGPTGHGSRSST
jgi:glycosyltransferase involved in cell wall biosynthesis